jgi:hypothetical protein
MSPARQPSLKLRISTLPTWTTEISPVLSPWATPPDENRASQAWDGRLWSCPRKSAKRVSKLVAGIHVLDDAWKEDLDGRA